MPGGVKLNHRQEQAIAYLLSERTIEAAAEKVGISERTLYAWLREPVFQTEYRAARQTVLERTVARLLALSGKATDVLERNLDCGKPTAEIRAAMAILRNAVDGVEQLDLVTELANLKAAIEEAKHGERGVSAGSGEVESNAARADSDGRFLVDASPLAS
jgi:hypothetical protein